MNRKIIAVAVTTALCLAFTACSSSAETSSAVSSAAEISSEEETEMIGMANPVVEYESLDEINEIAGTKLMHPAVMGVTDERFSVISGIIAQYEFSVNGVEYTFRAAPTYEDISGVYSDGGLLLDKRDDDGYAEDADGKIAKWYSTNNDSEVQYTLYVSDAGEMDMETFRGIASEMQSLTAYAE